MGGRWGGKKSELLYQDMCIFLTKGIYMHVFHTSIFVSRGI